ncbi:MAG: hypothetical protein L6R39_004876 [Caloplaca ligustica]|nr:MAG: hypothetical protein L6R39_004876 [Caloplaca ligustica]
MSSEGPDGQLNGTPQGKQESPRNNEPENVPKHQQSHKSDTSSSTANGVKDSAAKPPADEKKGKNDKVSGAELKKQAKADKAAKRAQAKQEQRTPLQDVSQPDDSKDKAGKRSKTQPLQTPDTKGRHRRKSSSSANPQRPLPLRQAQQQTSKPATEQPKNDGKKVALFSHLYGTPRRTTIAGAGKDVHPSVLALGLQMSNYLVCGSNARCVSTLLVFKRVIDAYTTPPGTSLPRHLTIHLSAQIDYLVSCRPLSVSMGNAIRWLKLLISRIDPDTPESEAKSHLCSAIDSFIRERITVAGQAIASSACSKIQDGDVILTFAKSSTVERTLAAAHRQGKKFRVIVVDSPPLHEGRNLARALTTLDIPVQYTLTHTLSHVIRDATKVFLGAHAMMSNGRLYSRIGTAIVAMTAKGANIPVIVLCESVKFTDKVALDSISINEIAPPEELGYPTPGTTTTETRGEEGEAPEQRWRDAPNFQPLNLMYDVTPEGCIHMVITEYGSLPPRSVPVVYRLSTDT